MTALFKTEVSRQHGYSLTLSFDPLSKGSYSRETIY